MWTNPQIPADLVTFTEEILNEKLHFLSSETLDWNVSPKITLNDFQEINNVYVSEATFLDVLRNRCS